MIHHFEEDFRRRKKKLQLLLEIVHTRTSLSALIECVALAQTSELGRHGAF